MTVKELVKYFEDWAPKGIAWENDNVGLQVGSQSTKIKNIFLALELTDQVLSEALNKNCNLIITHHPFIFNPIKKIDTSSDGKSRLIQKLLRHNVTLYSAHTNLDFTKDGVSFELGRKLGLKKIKFLVNQESNQFKLTVFVPAESVEKVAERQKPRVDEEESSPAQQQHQEPRAPGPFREIDEKRFNRVHSDLGYRPRL